MSDKIKSGKEILDNFFSKVKNLGKADSSVIEIVSTLHKNNKLTNTNLTNELERLRDKIK